MKNALVLLSIILMLAGCGSSGSDSKPDPVVDDIVIVDGDNDSSGGDDASVTPTCTHSDISGGVIVDNLVTLQDALTAASNNGVDDVIYVESGTYAVTDTLTYDAKGSLEKISIIGCGSDAVVFDGQNSTQVFHFMKDGIIGDDWATNDIYIGPYPSAELSGLSVVNGLCDPSVCNNSGKSGIALFERYHLDVKNVNFSNNFTEGEGAAINGVVDITVKDSTFDSNRTYSGFGGSAISASGVIDIDNSTFTNNGFRAVYRGISAEVNSCQDPVTINNSKFDGNGTQVLYVLYYGCKDTDVGTVNIIDSEFNNNHGSAMIVRGGNLTVTGSDFDNNRGGYSIAYLESDCVSHDFDCVWGGVIGYDKWMRSRGQVIIDDSNFTNNQAADYGGVIDMLGSADCTVSSDPQYAGCSSIDKIYSAETYDLVINDSVFVGNESHRGAVISVAKTELAKSFQNGNVYVGNSLFRNNVGVSNVGSTTPHDEIETSIIVTGGDLTYTGLTMENNVADVELNIKGSIIEL
ncbi:hypothetical protein GCM10009347_42100 [Shewanella algicola]|uniref:Right-handed parallel beta-helix repeat-containing protein n=1 Tax=Shewanella algicola TaxID=640633 RepID=A0A9X2CCE6_9GAMM|nr:right-handed parallel beta-helix repeat-containing protein [Shewanella algicola]MCL1107799.1 right-handed parallel beta-helix repeat-containing protein [Shewanella algicola]GGP73204.1 hypothetical protein GCM10009347_42100 [Shewanella algicola]